MSQGVKQSLAHLITFTKKNNRLKKSKTCIFISNCNDNHSHINIGA
ncbi:hypothetical protein HMPREF0484_0230 [Klebsiella pneumoniae subsp. rhinoscleromatis ATCC 13884]|nr:hypothetical protein HMPREF0484_0230 [Klebsiella pneumoniae subsp. rhinoscleromatis ATCC 13884]